MNVTDQTPIVTIRNVSYRRKSRIIYDRINLDIHSKKITGIIGPSGCGKTTLLKLIGAELRPDQGEIFFAQSSLHNIKRKELFKLRRSMGMLFQSGALFTDMNVFENVAFPLKVHTKLSKIMIRDIVLMKLQAVGLRGACQLMPAELSGGMARRVALARAIVLDPSLIMYDEPFVGQDPISKGVLVKLVCDLNSLLNITSIIVSHDLYELISIADYLYLIADGKIIAFGTPQDLLNSDDPKVCQFMQGNPDGAVPFHYPAISYAQELLHNEKK